MTGKLTISEAATRHLDLWADQLQRGDLQIWQLPLAVQQFISIGWADAHLMAVEQARNYEHQLDRMAIALLNPKDRAALLQRRLDQHFADQCDRFFAEPAIEGPAPEPVKESVCHHPVMSSGTLAPSFNPSDSKHARAA